MKKIPNDLFKKIVKLSDEVRADLRRRGIVVPVDNEDGSISIGQYKIVKTQSGLYNILDRFDDITVDNLNLPQSAVIVANNLALGRFVDTATVNLDRHYGYALFEELLHQRAVEKSKKKSLEYFDLMMTKCMIARAKKERSKREVVQTYEKLIKLV